jgi:hypothetical protein
MTQYTTLDGVTFTDKESYIEYNKLREQKNINSNAKLFRIIGVRVFSSPGYSKQTSNYTSDVYTKEDVILHLKNLHIKENLVDIIDNVEIYQLSPSIVAHNYEWEYKLYINIERLR